VKGYLLQFTAMFTVCFGAFAGALLVIYGLVPFIMWDFSILYDQQWHSFAFFMLRMILIISVIVSIFYCADAETKHSIRQYVEEGNKK
jgi:hypothetical protein